MFAIIETGGKQYKVSPGNKIKIEKLEAKEGDSLAFDKVLLVADQRGQNADSRGEEEIKIGTPYVSGARVDAKVLKQGRHDKIIVFKWHSKTRYRKKKGHRQDYTEVEILAIK